jgi:methionyl aminopeptidase
MRAAGMIVAETLRDLRSMVEPGISTRELDAYAEKKIRCAGAEPTFKGYHGFPASICASVNDEVVHGIPSVGDAAISVMVEETTPEVEALAKATQESLFHAMKQMVPGNHLFDVSSAVQEYVEARGYSVVREFCGHGIGQRMHEDPQVPNYGKPGTGPVLKEGWVLAVEPMVNIGRHQVTIDKDGWTVRTKDGSFSSHWEHTIAVTGNGPVILTALEDGTARL